MRIRMIAACAVLGMTLAVGGPARVAAAHGCDSREYRYERGLVFASLRDQERQLRADLSILPRDQQRLYLARFRADRRTVERIWIDANPCR